MDRILLEKYMHELQQGDINALDKIYEFTSRSTYLLAFSILKNSENARDIMQDTYLRVIANIDKYQINTNALAWITKIARNLSYRRFTNSSRDISLNTFEDTLSDNKNMMEFWATEIDLNNALGSLSTEEREIVTLFSIEGYKHREIAEITNKPLGTVLWIYNKAIKKLRKIMEK